METKPQGETPPEDAPKPGETPEPKPNEAGETPENPTPGEPASKAKTPEEMQAEIDRLQSALSNANRESAGRRKKIDALEAEDQKRKDAELSEAEREKKRADEAETRANAQADQLRRYAVLDATRVAAGKLNLQLNEAALQDIYAAGAFKDIELDDNGQPQGVDAHLKELVKTRPYLLQQHTQIPDINAQRGGKKDEIITDAEYEETARRFGLRVPKKR